MRDLVVGELVDLPERRIDLDTAASSTSLKPTEHENALAEIAFVAPFAAPRRDSV
jgi:hypothetical protein